FTMVAVRQNQQHERQLLARHEQGVQRVSALIQTAQQQNMTRVEKELRSAAALAESLNPYGVLARGYAIVSCGDDIQSVEELEPGQQIKLQGARDEAACTVQAVKKTETQGSHGL